MKFNTKEERDKFILDNMKLVDFCILNKINRYDKFDYSYEDIQHMGYVGLIKAVDRFDETKGKFSAYACNYIVAQILKDFRELHRGIRYGRKILLNKNKISERLKYKSIKEVAKDLNLTEREVEQINIMEISPLSLNIKIKKSEGKKESEYIDFITYKENDAKDKLNELLDCLSEKEKNIFLEHMLKGYTQTEIAKEIGVSQVQVGRIVKKSLNKLKKVC